ncbi:MAG: dicarboxylate/amino acid:cation symporter, partial [Desulfobacterales bacterium]|nr:dicarboxylate/amino acid:cation symporter [Desulfobacterales bacterium]
MVMSANESEKTSHAGLRTVTWLIAIALVLGALAGHWLHGYQDAPGSWIGERFESIRGGLWFIGNDIFIRLLKMLIMPLIISSVIVGVVSVGDFRRLGRIGLATLAYYFGTMLIAVTIGLTLVTVINPGQYISEEAVVRAEADYAADTKVQEKI